MAVFLLVRHGQNDMIGKKLAGRLPGVHLNREGQAQAIRLADAFSTLPISKPCVENATKRTVPKKRLQEIARGQRIGKWWNYDSQLL